MELFSSVLIEKSILFFVFLFFNLIAFCFDSFIFRSDIDTLQFQMTFEIPNIRVKAQYRSSGVLILVKASGAGDYWGQYGKANNNEIFINIHFDWIEQTVQRLNFMREN